MVADFISRFAGSECEALATQSEEAGITIAGGPDACEELICRVGTAVLMTLNVVFMRDRHTGSRGLAHIQRCAVAAEHFHWRPFRQHRDWRRRVRCELIS